MYAKATKGLQRLLRVYWVVHNFLRAHFTIREVPAVALGILERRLSVHEIFQIQMAEVVISKGKTVPIRLNQCPPSSPIIFYGGRSASITVSATVGHAA